jgi:hypothetical protein
MLLIEVIDICILNERISFGCFIRLSRCCKELRDFILNHVTMWSYLSKRFHLKKTPKVICKYIQSNKICRECAKTKGIITNTTRQNIVYVCSSCSESGYNRLLDRKQVMLRSWYSKKRNFILNELHVARIENHGKYKYWDFEWNQPFRGFLVKKYT